MCVKQCPPCGCCTTGEPTQTSAGTNAILLLTFCNFNALTDRGVRCLLAACPNLRNLVIEHPPPLLTVQVLESLHQHCAQIKKVYFIYCARCPICRQPFLAETLTARIRQCFLGRVQQYIPYLIIRHSFCSSSAENQNG